MRRGRLRIVGKMIRSLDPDYQHQNKAGTVGLIRSISLTAYYYLLEIDLIDDFKDCSFIDTFLCYNSFWQL
jgi:hypothetical protein